MNINIKTMNPLMGRKFQLPSFATTGAAALDLIACTTKPIRLDPGQQEMIGSGIAIDIRDPSFAAVILPRSGLGSRGLILGNTVGLIDSDYQGELKMVLWNRSIGETFVIEPGDRIAQLVFIPVARPNLILVDEFVSASTRGTGGFGSTGN